MKKYNLSTIMENAWTIRREKSISKSAALKQAWVIAKAHATEAKMFELVKASNARIIRGQLMVARDTSAEVIAEVKEHKSKISAYLSGDCFRLQSQLFDAPVEWVVLKRSATPYVSFPPCEVFRGTAGEVDDWMAARRNERCAMEFGDGTSCQAKYVTTNCA